MYVPGVMCFQALGALGALALRVRYGRPGARPSPNRNTWRLGVRGPRGSRIFSCHNLLYTRALRAATEGLILEFSAPTFDDLLSARITGPPGRNK